MIKFIKNLFSNVKRSLFTYNSQPFSTFSIIFIILLDIFLFITIVNGIQSETKMAPQVYQKYPQLCQNHFSSMYKHKLWDNTTNQYLYTEDTFPFKDYSSFPTINNYGYYSSQYKVKDDTRISPICKELNSKINVFTKSKQFISNKKLLENLKNQKRNTLSDIHNIEKRYNTALFEKAAKVTDINLKHTKDKYYSLLSKEKFIDRQIKNIKPVYTYKGYKDYVSFVNKNRDIFKEELKKYIFWQPFISFLYLLKFTLPLILLFMFTYKISNRINRKESVPMKLLKLISSHIILISLIPIFLNVLYLIYHIIPHRFFEKVIKFLYEFGFIFLGYYALMFIGIIFFGFIIYFIQKNVLKREQLRQELKEKTLYIDSYNNSICPNCKNKVDYSRNFCGSCKEELNRKCSSCGSKTPKNIEYCLDCGES